MKRIESYLNDKYAGLKKVIEKQYRKTKPEEIYTKLLVGHVLKHHCKLSDDNDIFSHITDGRCDKGLDGIYFDSTSRKLTLIQAKYTTRSKSTAISERDAGEFSNGVEELISGRIFEDGYANDKIASLEDEIRRFMKEYDVSIELIIVTTSSRQVTKGAKQRIEKVFKDIHTLDSDRIIYMGLDEIYDSMKPAELLPGSDFDIDLLGAQAISMPHLGYYGYASGMQIAKLVDEKGDPIFAKNLRKALGGATPVNREIVATARDDAEHFWYFNNGITIIADKIERARGMQKDTARLRLKNGSIVNGAQTASSLFSLIGEDDESLESIKCMIRIIEVPEGDIDFAQNVTKWNNSQNAIGAKDFVSLDSFQIELREQLNALYGIVYTIRSGDDLDHDSSFGDKISLQEATLALVCCGNSIENVVRAKSYISGLWKDIESDPYLTIFDKSRVNAHVVVKSVDFLRFTEIFLRKVRDDDIESDIFSAFNQDKLKQLASHGNRLFQFYVADKVFSTSDFANEKELRDTFLLRFKSINLESLFANFANIVFNEYPNSYLARLFKNSSKCKEVVAKLRVEN